MNPFTRRCFVAKEIKKRRRKRGFTQKTMASRMKLTPRVYQQKETAQVPFDIEETAKAAKIFQVKFESLVLGEEDRRYQNATWKEEQIRKEAKVEELRKKLLGLVKDSIEQGLSPEDIFLEEEETE